MPEGLPPLPARPPFPPPGVALAPAFPPELGDAAGGGLLSAWSFLQSFGDLLGLLPFTLDALLDALALGPASPLLADVHVGLLRLLQADAEESHGAGGVRALGPGLGVPGLAAERLAALMGC